MVEILKKAGISFIEFAELAGVSRNMVYKWSKGAKPHPLREPRINKLLQAIDAATVSGDLPIDKSYNNDTAAKFRGDKLKLIVINTIKKSAAPA